MFKKLKKNNKGFSLVELIIVIAIMAALVAILAPQYLKYVEKSRVTADENIANEIVSALKVAAVDDNYSEDFAAGTVVLSKSAAPTAGAYADALTEYYGNYDNAKLKSKEYAGGITIKVEAADNGGWSITWNKTAGGTPTT